LYSLKPKPGHAGYTIAPVFTPTGASSPPARPIDTAAPTTDYLQFPPDAAFYRLFYESWAERFQRLRSSPPAHPPTWTRQTDKLQASGASASCQDVNNEMCLQIPKDVAVNPMISVTVNGDDVLLNRGSRLANAITAAGEQKSRRDPAETSRLKAMERPRRSAIVRSGRRRHSYSCLCTAAKS